MNYCAVKDGKAYQGNKSEIVAQVAKISIENARKPTFQISGFKATQCGYTDEWTQCEVYLDLVKHIFNKLPDYGFKIYKEITP